jgi:regulator of RNase E activity RraA
MSQVILHPAVRSATISDSLDLLGIRNNAMSLDIKPLDRSMKITGYAATIEFVPGSEYDATDPYAPAIDFLDSLQEGEVAVVATGKSVLSAFWGELFSTAAKGRGATGVVSDGPLRDVGQIFEVGFNAFGTGTSPYDYKGRMQVRGVRTQVTCGGVSVSPGDFIIADIDGVVVVPKFAIEQVFAAANARALGENHVLKDLKAGSSVRAAWDRHHIL